MEDKNIEVLRNGNILLLEKMEIQTQSKYPIKIKGDKEIEDGSSINLDYLNKTYKVKLYEYEDIRIYLENI